MSYLAREWAEQVPVSSVYERVILMCLAQRADKDGCAAFPSKANIARTAMCDPKTIQRHLDALRNRRVIAYGDQQAAHYIPARYRPNVYDLLIPHEWFSRQQLAEINRDRAEKGKPALGPEDRPPLPPPPGKSSRSDKGKSKPRTSGKSAAETPPVDNSGEPASNAAGTTNQADPSSQVMQGGLSVPPDARPAQGGLSVPARGDSQSRLREDSQSPKPVQEINPSHKPPGGQAPLKPPTRALASLGCVPDETASGSVRIEQDSSPANVVATNSSREGEYLTAREDQDEDGAMTRAQAQKAIRRQLQAKHRRHRSTAA